MKTTTPADKAKTKVVAIVRVSGKAQAREDKVSIPIQRERIKALCAIHGLEVVEEIPMQGVSGAKWVDDTSHFQRFVKLLASSDIAVFVVPSFPRLSRPKLVRFLWDVLKPFPDGKKI